MMHHCGTYDVDREVMIVCGRTDYASDGTNQTWEFNGTTWHHASNLLAGVDGDVEIAYDTHRKKTVAYVADFFASETWEYDGTNWTLITMGTVPTPLFDGAIMQFDPIRSNVVLVVTTNDAAPIFAETWTYDGNNWSNRGVSLPTNALLGGMAYHAARTNIVLLTTDSETWTWDGTEWTEEYPAHSPTPARGYFTMAYDPNRQVSAFFSGEYSTGELVHPIDTWEWDGDDWSQFVPVPEPALCILLILVTTYVQHRVRT